MAGFSVLGMMNNKSRVAAGATTSTEYKEIYLSPYEVKEAPQNTRQECKDIDKLADSFLLVGQEQPTVLARVNGEYWIIDGHRRNRANIYNLERGYKEYEKVRYFYRDMSEIMYELSLLAGNGYTQELTDYEKTDLAARLKAALEKARDAGEIVIEGRVRDLVGEILGEKPTNMARMEKINNGATEEVKEQFKEGNLGISAAYEAAKLPPEEQQAIAARAAAGENVKTKEIAQKVAQNVAAKAQEKADAAARAAEQAEIEAQEAIDNALDKQAQAEKEAENAKELKRYVDEKAQAPEVSETDTEKQLVIGLPENRDAWNFREWGIFTVRSLMYHVDIMDEGDVAELQNVLLTLEERARGKEVHLPAKKREPEPTQEQQEAQEPEQQNQGEQLPGQMTVEDLEGVEANE